MAPPPAPAAPDGRVARGERTKRSLAEALVALLEEGEPQPTARQVAERAGVSLRLVFHHFDDMEQVLRAAVSVQTERHWRRIAPVDPGLPARDRVAAVVRQRAALYEGIAPVRRAAELAERTSSTVATELAHSRRALRAQLAGAFATELGERRTQAADRMLDALDVAASWETWEHLRLHLGRSPAGAARVVELLLLTSLEGNP